MSIQKRTDLWMTKCFDQEVIVNKHTRNMRFLEEALELVQACGLDKEAALVLVEYVYDRPTGDIGQEIGGTLISLAALCSAHQIDMDMATDTELKRVDLMIDKIREKQSIKDQVLEAIRVRLKRNKMLEDKRHW